MTKTIDTGLKRELDAEVERRVADVHGLIEREAAAAGVELAGPTEGVAARPARHGESQKLSAQRRGRAQRRRDREHAEHVHDSQR